MDGRILVIIGFFFIPCIWTAPLEDSTENELGRVTMPFDDEPVTSENRIILDQNSDMTEWPDHRSNDGKEMVLDSTEAVMNLEKKRIDPSLSMDTTDPSADEMATEVVKPIHQDDNEMGMIRHSASVMMTSVPELERNSMTDRPSNDEEHSTDLSLKSVELNTDHPNEAMDHTDVVIHSDHQLREAISSTPFQDDQVTEIPEIEAKQTDFYSQDSTEPNLLQDDDSSTDPSDDSTTFDPISTSLHFKSDDPIPSRKRMYHGYRVYRVLVPSEEAIKRILSLEDEPGVEFWADPRLLLRPRGLFVTSAADIMVAPKAIPMVEHIFNQAKLPFNVLVDDVQNAISKENRKSITQRSNGHPLTWERYHRLKDIYGYLDYLREQYPELVQLIQIGKSGQGRPIKLVKIHQNDGVDNKKAIFIDAGFHGNEWITTSSLTWMLKELTEKPEKYTCILHQFDWYFVPVVNPDGYEYSHTRDRLWKKTRTDFKLLNTTTTTTRKKLRQDSDESECFGTDLNRNFEYKWRSGGSSINVCSSSFAGIRPFSEPESQALAHFILKKKKDIAMYMTLHSYSQMWLLPWGYTEQRPEDYSQLFSLAKIGARALQQVHNTSFLIGSIPDLLSIASGTSQDWAKGVAGIQYSYTLELRGAGKHGLILPSNEIVSTSEETWKGIYFAIRELATRVYNETFYCNPI